MRKMNKNERVEIDQTCCSSFTLAKTCSLAANQLQTVDGTHLLFVRPHNGTTVALSEFRFEFPIRIGQMHCPCGLTFEFLDKHNLVGDGGVCTAWRKGSNKTIRCGELAIDQSPCPTR
jgi:hypothetical protein